MERFGFVGLPNAGKSSLYNALAGGGALAAPYAFATVEPNVGIAKVPDDRLDQLADMSESLKAIPTSVQFTDIGGLVEGASQGEGLGNKFLQGIRESDGIVFVLRAFGDPDVPGPTDPLEHLGILEIELALADLDSAERQLDKRRRQAKGDASAKIDVELLDEAVTLLGEGKPLYRSGMTKDRLAALKPFFLLTNKPVMAVVNVGEDDLDEIPGLIERVSAELAGAEVLGMCIQLEAEAALMDLDERTELLEGLGLGEGALPPILTRCLSPAWIAHVFHHRRERVPSVDVPCRSQSATVRRCDPHRLRTRFHPGRDDPMGPAYPTRWLGQGPRSWRCPHGRQGLRGRRW